MKIKTIEGLESYIIEQWKVLDAAKGYLSASGIERKEALQGIYYYCKCHDSLEDLIFSTSYQVMRNMEDKTTSYYEIFDQIEKLIEESIKEEEMNE